MDRILVLALVVSAAALPHALADTGGGNGVGAGGAGTYVGVWDIWRVYVSAPGTLDASLTWVPSPNGADYDLTLWAPGADLDGRLSPSEILAKSWTASSSPGEHLAHPVAPAGSAYVVTVESMSAKLETYYLTVTGGQLVRTCHAFSPPFTCMWSASGVKQR